jgi:hypothetical protein
MLCMTFHDDNIGCRDARRDVRRGHAHPNIGMRFQVPVNVHCEYISRSSHMLQSVYVVTSKESISI